MNAVIAKKILVIDDEPSMRKLLRHSLESHQFQVIEAETGKEGLQKVIEARPDLVILDYGMPEMTGIEVLKKLREWSKVPVIFLTVKDDDRDKVEALDSGADDYLTKPFSVTELIARIRVAFRHAEPQSEEPIIRFGVIEIDRSAHVVRSGGKAVKLTATEYSLLGLLANHSGKLVPHRTILKEIWGPNSVEHGHYLRIHFGQIRKKLNEVSPGSGNLIENESSIGYRLKSE